MSTLLPILGGFIGGFLALFGIWLKLLLDTSSQDRRTSTIVFAEWADIARHFDRNVDRIKSMKYELSQQAKWPERVHIEKLKWPEDTYIFDNMSIQYSTAKTVSNIYKMRLRLRNANLDVDAAMRAFLTGKTQIFLQTLAFVEGRHLRVGNLALELQNKTQRKAMDGKGGVPNTDDMLFFDEPLLN